MFCSLKKYFSKIEVWLFTTLRDPPTQFDKRPHFFRIFFSWTPSLSNDGDNDDGDDGFDVDDVVDGDDGEQARVERAGAIAL